MLSHIRNLAHHKIFICHIALEACVPNWHIGLGRKKMQSRSARLYRVSQSVGYRIFGKILPKKYSETETRIKNACMKKDTFSICVPHPAFRQQSFFSSGEASL